MAAKARNYVFTLNNYTPAEEDLLKALECRFIGWGYETAPETNTPHLQGLVCFTNPRSFEAVRRIVGRWHVEKVRSTVADAWAYCQKIDNHLIEGAVANVVWSKGEIPMDQKTKGEMNIERYKRAYENARDHSMDLDTIDPDILICHYSAIKHIRRDNMPKCDILEGPCGLWLQGPSGCGKTTYTTQKFVDAYLKPINKWWDGYNNEPVVVLDDLDKTHASWIGYFLKKWSDKFPFIAEQKGTSVKIRPKRFVVTTQYTIGDIFTDDETYEAINRRFVQVNLFDLEVRQRARNLEDFVPEITI